MDRKPFCRKKIIKSTCSYCKGKGCKSCNKGIVEDYYYIISDGKVAFDADTLK